MADYVYILASRPNGTLYIGVTDHFVRGLRAPVPLRPGLHAPVGGDRLVWFESRGEVTSAIQREKNLKHWLRRWKVDLIERANPTWRDRYDEIAG